MSPTAVPNFMEIVSNNCQSISAWTGIGELTNKNTVIALRSVSLLQPFTDMGAAVQQRTWSLPSSPQRHPKSRKEL